MNLNFVSKYHIGTRWRLRIIRSLLNIKANDQILDAGCGEGYISFVISRRAKKLLGVDISKEVIKFNNGFSDGCLKFLALDLNNLVKKTNNKFDKIICMDVLEHAEGFENIIKNFSDSLNKGGQFVATIPVYEGHGHFKYNDFKKINSIFENVGLKIDKLGYIQMPFFTKFVHNLILILRKLVGYDMKEVDTFDKTLSFELRKNETLVYKVYKLFFRIIFLITYLDIKPYKKGKDFILIKAVKK